MRRFASDWTALWPEDSPVGLAVSGGPDSLALLALAHAALPGKFAVATVDHRLRAASADEAAMVAGLCDRLEIAHRTLAVEVLRKGNLSAQARTARYAALGAWAVEQGLAAIATAHHADDQAETLLLRLNRGAGLTGLAAMRPRAPLPGSPDIALLRPLLGWRKAELVAVVAAAGWTPADDPSNRDPRFDRARLRAALAANAWLDPARVAASAAHLRDAADALDWAVAREFAERVAADGDVTDYRPTAPRAIRLGVLARIVAQTVVGAQPPRGAELARLLASLEAGGVATLGGWRGDARGGDGWRFTRPPPHRA